ncbi:carboxypeptidase-like regulatory domain-containing protein [Mucilaginibacter sp. OK098]|uniref:carboxypeptidase-like regulatory domain-containing protein n=1 Tax=Mucilaginibacter sp. OK098 TaxID=1855297 RepID=UPI000916F999|nr:carboxypeptidase-like regulatory domain-containing protein [Mucilaginibacter sp. OK098]SHM81460.1 CarboxypepD_reg-like domain-containing protein [Mucilaginibacter sp. OK098]
MKNICFILLVFFGGTKSFSQTISISGTVKDAQGQPVPVAFVRDAQHYYATYADSSGAFTLKADPASSLIAIALGYTDTKVAIENKGTINIVMAKGTSSSDNSSGISGNTGNSSNNLMFVNRQNLVAQVGSSQVAKAGFNQEPTKGSPYMFVNWVQGFAVSKGDSLLFDLNSLYNYDKMSGDLLFTRDKNVIMQVNKQQVKYFSLSDGKLYPHVFESAPAISKKPFVELLVNTSKYKVYKITDTRLERANFHSDGVIETGNRYDEYQDVVHYYFVKLPDGAAKQFSLKWKAIKELFAGDADKFLASHNSLDINDDYLRELNLKLPQ